MTVKVDPQPLRQRRLFRMPGSGSAVLATNDRVALVGGVDSSIVSSKDGNTINGKLSIMAAPNDIRIGGMWVLNPLLVSTVPSTMVTPIPVFLFNMPGQQFLRDFGTSVAAMMSFLV